jgi:hypothetical protein
MGICLRCSYQNRICWGLIGCRLIIEFVPGKESKRSMGGLLGNRERRPWLSEPDTAPARSNGWGCFAGSEQGIVALPKANTDGKRADRAN